MSTVVLASKLPSQLHLASVPSSVTATIPPCDELLLSASDSQVSRPVNASARDEVGSLKVCVGRSGCFGSLRARQQQSCQLCAIICSSSTLRERDGPNLERVVQAASDDFPMLGGPFGAPDRILMPFLLLLLLLLLLRE